MKRNGKLLIMLVVLFISIVLVVSACGEKKVVEKVAKDEVEVSIHENSFVPHFVMITPGTTVTWTNDDEAVIHGVVNKDEIFKSEGLSNGEKFSYKFEEAGIYSYGCINHSSEGVILVQEEGETANMFKGRDAKTEFVDSCSGCHGAGREGGVGVALIPERLVENDEFYFETIRHGKHGAVMPEHDEYSDAEIWAFIGMMRSEPDSKALRWEMSEIEESRQILISESNLPVSPTHSGNIDNIMLVTERETRSVVVIDGDTHEKIGTLDSSYRAHGYTFNPVKERYFYNIGRDGWLMKMDLYSLETTIKVRVGLDSRSIAMSDDGKHIIVGNYIPRNAVILDADTLEPTKIIMTEGEDPQGEFVTSRVCVVSDVATEVGSYFIIALKEAGHLWRIDWSDPEFPIDKLPDIGNMLHDGFLRPDNKRFYIASQTDNWMTAVDVESWEIIEKIETGGKPHPGTGAVWTANGVEYGATVHLTEGKVAIWELENNTIIANVPTAGPGLFVRAADNNPYLWADAPFGDPSNQTLVIDKFSFEIVHTIEEGEKTLHPELTYNGKFVYISDWKGNVVRVYDAYTFEKVAEIPADSPTGIFCTSRRLETLGH